MKILKPIQDVEKEGGRGGDPTPPPTNFPLVNPTK